MLTRAADYAARVMIHLAMLPPGTRVQRVALAEVAEVPESFMSKVLQGLVRARMISSKTGANGGFALAVSAEEVSLLDIVEAIDGPVAVNVCVGAGQGCERHNWCGAHMVWMEAQEAITRVLKSATVARMAQQTALLRGAAAAAGDSGAKSSVSIIR
jgi:Rrf2 family protein